MTRVRHRTLDHRSGDRIWPIQHDHFDSRLRCSLDKISQGRFIGIKPGPRILDIKYNGVQPFQHFERWPARRICRSVHAVHRHARCIIFRIANHRRVHRPGHPVFWTENRFQRNSGRLRQHINRPPPVRIHPGLIRDQPDLSFRLAALQPIEPVRLEQVEPGLHVPVADRQLSSRALRLVISSNAFPA